MIFHTRKIWKIRERTRIVLEITEWGIDRTNWKGNSRNGIVYRVLPIPPCIVLNILPLSMKGRIILVLIKVLDIIHCIKQALFKLEKLQGSTKFEIMSFFEKLRRRFKNVNKQIYIIFSTYFLYLLDWKRKYKKNLKHWFAIYCTWVCTKRLRWS